MKNMNQKPTLRQAFTLIEMLIVISIIGLLAALTLGISSSVMRNSEIRQTENALKVLSMAMQEWELEMGRSVTFKGVLDETDFGMYDIDMSGGSIGYPGFGGQGVENDIMAQEMKVRNVTLVDVLSDVESSKNVLAKIETDLLSKDTSGMFVIDPWGNPLGIVFPGKYFADVFPSGNMFAQDSSGDLTVRDDVEDGLGSCINQRPYFVSAGPDGLWGYRFQAGDGPISSDPASMALWNATLDNIYSYKPYIVEGAR